MSNAFAIGAVSAVLKNLLDNAIVNEPLATSTSPVKVSVIAPDLVKAATTEKTRLNLFLYHVEPNAAWRNVALPSRDGNGNRVTNQPLALDLFYLLTAYSETDYEAEILLGYAAQLLHQVPVLSREMIRKTFESAAAAPITQFATSGLADQVEQIKISPHAMSSEETSKLWSALMTNYRPSIAYHISVVLIEADRPSRRPLPVLRRNIEALPALAPPYPTLTAALAPNEQPAIRLGETLTLEGHDLAGSSVVARFDHPRLTNSLTVNAATSTPEKVTLAIPNLPAAWPAGNYMVSLQVTKSGQPPRTSNALPLMVAPEMTVVAGEIDGTATRPPTGILTIVLNNVKPQVLVLQRAELIAGGHQAIAQPRTAPATSLTFIFDKPSAPPPGVHWMRLRIDGVDSILVRRDTDPPSFDPNQKKTLP
ncbi:MAG TPA: DUF4255 domain-containing protein [Thermoanaerobaculia bacterium]|nr:DUF4255 domain-containing protein [Thermoanaerobaculia bacterium]